MGVTVFFPADPQAYGEMITREQDFQRAAAMPFVKKHVVVPYSRDLLRASADSAAREIGPTQVGPATIVYWKIKDRTAFVLLNIDTDGWAGVSFTRAYCHSIVERTLLQFKGIKRVVWDEAPGEKTVYDARGLEWMPVGFAPTGAQHWATVQEIAQAKARLRSLRPNMTDDQVFATLGLSRCYASANGHGPRERFSLSYDMVNGHGLVIVHNCVTSSAITLTSVGLDDAIWKPDETASR